MVTEMHCFEIFAFEKYFDLETLLGSISLLMTPFVNIKLVI